MHRRAGLVLHRMGTAMMESPGLAVGRVQRASLLFLPIHLGQAVMIRTRQVEGPIPEEVGMEEVHMQAELQDHPLEPEDRGRAVLDFPWVQDQRDKSLNV